MATKITATEYRKARNIVERYEAQKRAEEKQARAIVRKRAAKTMAEPKRRPTLEECGGDVNKWLRACDPLLVDGGYIYHPDRSLPDRITIGAQEGLKR